MTTIPALWPTTGHLNEAQRIFLTSLLAKKKPSFCLEIGFCTGRSALTILEAALPAKLISIDKEPNRRSANSILEAYPNLRLVIGDTLEILTPEFLKAEFPKGIDFAFIDGGHTFTEAFHDISASWKSLKKNGVMVVDDYHSCEPDGCILEGVNRAVDTFLENEKAAKLEVWHENGKGFAVITKA